MNGLKFCKISLSVVLYNTKQEDIENILKSLEYVKAAYHLYIIDNSLTNDLKINFENKVNVEYIHNPSNPGFGASHNIAILKAIEANNNYHFVINPDVFFVEDVISEMVNFMQEHPRIGMMMPQILNLDGTIQNLPKLLPSPYSVFLRKIKKPNFLYANFIAQYELREVPREKIYDAPILSGCFTILNLEAIKEVGTYDDNYFMYFEDWDLSRRVNQKYRTVYYPLVSVYHGYESGANKNKKLFKIFIKSCIHYFNKWGWIFDRERIKINRKTLKQFK
ncbi:GT2 family glycosyltransferase [Flavobacterium arsenatis]|uniref:GT2 family glycosyltransferase n=1 Tax=Flavobacterium arsenatis TaxID=1484332 RepID=A0ABU1TQX9_9FLAO|nr:glycosyltransferase family 2 protein [Flavobacterium arsenatis]MDR6968291.1 GT2 family glycosyltransferase [Flavobacterium arsenatis]